MSSEMTQERLVGQMLAKMEGIIEQLQTITPIVTEIRAGEIRLPQCREYERRIDSIERDVIQLKAEDLDRRLATLEKHEAERKDDHKWTLRQILGPMISSAIGALLVYLGMKK